MALFHYDKNHNYRKNRKAVSVIRVSYQKDDITKNYFSLSDNYKFIVRFSFVCSKPENIEQEIYDCNKRLRIIFNKKATSRGIPLNGVRYITVRQHGKVVYNIVLDKLISAIWLFSKLVDIENTERFSWLKTDKDLPVERIEYLKAHLRPHFFNMIKKVFEENNKVAKVEVDNAGIYIGITGYEKWDINPELLPTWYGDKPRYRAIQHFGNLSKNSKPSKYTKAQKQPHTY